MLFRSYDAHAHDKTYNLLSHIERMNKIVPSHILLQILMTTFFFINYHISILYPLDDVNLAFPILNVRFFFLVFFCHFISFVATKEIAIGQNRSRIINMELSEIEQIFLTSYIYASPQEL